MKLYNILFVLAFVFALSACGGEKKNDETADTDDQEQTDDHATADHDEDKAKEEESSADIKGDWNVVSVAGEEMPEGISMVLSFNADGKLSMATPEGNQEASYTLSEDGKTIDVKSPDGDEQWKVKELTAEKLVLLDEKKDEEMVLKK